MFWLLGHSALVQATSLLVSRQLSVTRAEAVAAVGLVGIAIGGFLWTRFSSPLQQLAVFSSVLLLVEGLALTDTNAGLSGGPNYGDLALFVIVLGVTWFLLAVKGVIAPRRTGLVLGTLAIVIGPVFLSASGSDPGSGFLLMALAAATMVAVGEGIDDRAVVGLGIAALILGSVGGWASVIGTSNAGSVAALVGGLAAIVIGAVLLWTPVRAPMPPPPVDVLPAEPQS